MGKLSTHVLNTMHGIPAAGVLIDLYAVHDDGQRQLINQHSTNIDGRCDQPLLKDAELKKGIYELVFHAGDYFSKLGVDVPEPRFVDQITLRFGVAKPNENYHVPLVVTPWTWSTYRGS